MKSRLLRGKGKRVVFSLLLVLPWLILLLIRGVAPLSLSYTLGFLAIMTTFVSLAFLFTPTSVRTASRSLSATMTVSSPVQEAAPRRRSSFPLTAFDVHRQMSDVDFEYLAAAVIMVLEGYRFDRRCGGRGDQGVDVVLINHYGQRVVVQAKRYATDRSIDPSKIRELKGAMDTYNAAKGFFVTTASLTRAARHTVHGYDRLYALYGAQLDTHLQNYPDQIEQTYHSIRSSATS